MTTAETLRSTQLPKDILSGTRLFLRFYAGRQFPYVIETRWQTLRRTKDLFKAEALFEHITYGEISPLP